MNRPAVIIFLRAPEKGRVKTRLAGRSGNGRGLDEDSVLTLYRAFVEDTIEAAGRHENLFLFFHPPDRRPLLESWLGTSYRYEAQADGDIGNKMAHAFKSIFARGVDRAVLVGTDIPELNPEHLDQAGTILERADAVIGPSLDGGYYLIGMNRSVFSVNFFSGISWSTPHVLDETLSVFRQHGITFELLQPLNDVDTPDDLNRLKKNAVSGSTIGTRSAKILASCES